LQYKDKFDIFTIGCSSGGFAALLFGNLLRARRIVCLSPQTLLPRPLPFPDTKCLAGVDPTYFDLLHALDWRVSHGEIHLYYSHDYDSDRLACERMQQAAGVHLHPFSAGKEHNIAGWLRSRGLLAQEIRRCFSESAPDEVSLP
jgi:hypothetical protein